MTGDELFELALDECNADERSIDTDETKLAAWKLRTLNRCGQNFYYYLESKLQSANYNIDTEKHNFLPFDVSENPETSFDVLLPNSEVRVQALYVKYSNDGALVRCEQNNLNNFPVDLKELQQHADEYKPQFAIINRNIHIFPKPKVAITNGVEVYFKTPFSDLEETSDAIVGIGIDHQQVLIPFVASKILRRLRKPTEAIQQHNIYLNERSEAAKQFRSRLGSSQRLKSNVPRYV